MAMYIVQGAVVTHGQGYVDSKVRISPMEICMAMYYVEQKNGARGCYPAGSCWHTVFLHSTVQDVAVTHRQGYVDSKVGIRLPIR